MIGTWLFNYISFRKRSFDIYTQQRCTYFNIDLALDYFLKKAGAYFRQPLVTSAVFSKLIYTQRYIFISSYCSLSIIQRGKSWQNTEFVLLSPSPPPSPPPPPPSPPLDIISFSPCSCPNTTPCHPGYRQLFACNSIFIVIADAPFSSMCLMDGNQCAVYFKSEMNQRDPVKKHPVTCRSCTATPALPWNEQCLKTEKLYTIAFLGNGCDSGLRTGGTDGSLPGQK